MLETCFDLEIKMRIPEENLVFYPDETKDEFVTDPNFQKILDYLNIKIDIHKLYNDLTEYNRTGRSNPTINIYYSDNSYKDFIITDTYTYHDPTDQLDLIVVCIRCTEKNAGIIRQYAHEFYQKQCKYNIMYAEGNFVIQELYNTDFSQYKTGFSRYKESVKSYFKYVNYENKYFSFYTFRNFKKIKIRKRIRFYKSGNRI